MGKFIPVSIAFILLCKGIQIFRIPDDVGRGPLIATYIYMFSAYLLFWDIRLYPKSLRKLGRCCQCFIEYLIATFLFENILIDFWFPLEIVILAFPQKLAIVMEDLLSTGNWTCDSVCEFLKDESLGLILSYAVSIFFLLSVLHATRAIDLRELECGIGPFIHDIIFRLKRSIKRTKRSLGIGQKRRVQIKESRKGCKGSVSKTKVCNNNPCLPSEDYGDFGDEDEPIQQPDCYDDNLRHTFSDFEMNLAD